MSTAGERRVGRIYTLLPCPGSVSRVRVYHSSGSGSGWLSRGEAGLSLERRVLGSCEAVRENVIIVRRICCHGHE